MPSEHQETTLEQISKNYRYSGCGKQDDTAKNAMLKKVLDYVKKNPDQEHIPDIDMTTSKDILKIKLLREDEIRECHVGVIELLKNVSRYKLKLCLPKKPKLGDKCDLEYIRKLLDDQKRNYGICISSLDEENFICVFIEVDDTFVEVTAK